MTETRDEWELKRERGLFRYLLLDGIVWTGGPFAVVMQVIGYFLFNEEESFRAYFASSTTWTLFFLHGVLFGLVIGYIKWRRNEAVYAAASSGTDG